MLKNCQHRKKLLFLNGENSVFKKTNAVILHLLRLFNRRTERRKAEFSEFKTLLSERNTDYRDAENNSAENEPDSRPKSDLHILCVYNITHNPTFVNKKCKSGH